MAEKIVKTTFLIKRGTQFQFESNGIVLKDGEPSYTTDTHIFKVGDGKNVWKDLPSVNGSGSGELDIELINGGNAYGN